MDMDVDPVSRLDPVALSDSSYPAEDESDLEYEYHDHETESFYLNLDLTSFHGPMRPPRRRQDVAAASTSTAPTVSSAVPSQTDEIDSAVASPDSVLAERVQILGLHTRNPIVSYHNQIFSCFWADQIGTELLFSRPELGSEPDPDPESEFSHFTPLKHTKDYDLIAANSVKILGRKANLISSAGSDGITSGSGDMTPSLSTRGPAFSSNQARFLDRLKQLKETKGETDTVRTVYNMKRSQNLEERLRGWARTDEQLAELTRLNDAAMQGNADALAELENLYTQIGNREGAMTGD